MTNPPEDDEVLEPSPPPEPDGEPDDDIDIDIDADGLSEDESALILSGWPGRDHLGNFN